MGEVHHCRHHAADFVTTAYTVLVESVLNYFLEVGLSLDFWTNSGQRYQQTPVSPGKYR